MFEKFQLSDVVPFVPPAIGAVLGARYAQNQTPRERLLSWLLSMATGWFIGAGVGEHFGLSYGVTGAIMFTLAAVGMEALAYVIAAFRQATADPASAARKWIDAILGRRADG